eukprot:scaffold36672_cov40-Phaeocystis_antarctica.AAC.1
MCCFGASKEADIRDGDVRRSARCRCFTSWFISPHTSPLHQVGLPHPAYRSQLVDRISATASAMRVRSPLVT